MSDQAISEVFAQATDAEMKAAELFYGAAHVFAGEVAALAGITLNAAAAIIAVLSPRSNWEGNQFDAIAVASGCDFSCGGFQALGRDLERARRIADGGRWSEILSGPKVIAFARNIMFPGRDVGIPVDRHLARLALGWGMSDEELTRSLARKGAYRDVEERYELLAGCQGLRPIVYANRVWYVVRRLRREGGQLSFSWRPLDWMPVGIDFQGE